MSGRYPAFLPFAGGGIALLHARVHGHGIDAASDDDAFHAGENGARRDADGSEPAGAMAVDRHTGGIQHAELDRGVARNGAAAGHRFGEHDVINLVRRKA